MFRFSITSLKRMQGVHSDLVRCATLALQRSPVDFMVGRDGGIRTIEKQRELMGDGNSKTLNSKHLPQEDGTSHAIDLWVWHKGDIPWNDKDLWCQLSGAMFDAAKELGITLRWGGDWDMDGDTTDQSFNDWAHFELVNV